jgi:hypothetical protein
VPITFNELGRNLRRPMTLFPEIFNEAALLHGYGKCREGVWEFLYASYFLSDEHCPLDFHKTLAQPFAPLELLLDRVNIFPSTVRRFPP